MDYVIIKKYINMNRSGKKLNAIGTVVHETDDSGASDENEFNYFNSGNRKASAHAFVDYDSIFQMIPWDEEAWHAGHTANSTRIGIELCHYDDAERFKEVWKRAVWLFSWVHINIIKQSIITKENLMSHAEVSAKWGETTHKDPVSYFAEFGKTVDNFRNEVQIKINEMLRDQEQNHKDKLPEPKVSSIDTDILKLQKVLNMLKITDGNGNSLKEDGALDLRTTKAIKIFQKLTGIPSDGSLGQQTMRAIELILNKPLLKIRSKGIPVRYIQFRLNVPVDGIFGPITKRAVMEFQNSQEIKTDGIVGPITWSKLIS